VAELCRRLDGIPLAIELAAARVRALTPCDLLARLDQRFRLLTRGSRAALERHQTLRSTIDWSYDLLLPAEKSALNRLAVFAGGCELRAAEAILSGDDLDSAEVADVLGQLVDKSLVIVEETSTELRYRLLETIRQYAQERLEAQGEAAALRRRHAEWYTEAAREAGEGLRSAEQVATGRAVAREIDNYRAALDWALERADVDAAMRLVSALCVYGRTNDVFKDWAEAASEIPGAEQHELFPTVAAWAAFGAVVRREFERAEALVARGRAAGRAPAESIPEMWMARATLAFFRNDLEGAQKHAEAWAQLGRERGSDYQLAHALIMWGAAMNFALSASGQRILEEATTVARRGGIASALSIALSMHTMNLMEAEPERAAASLVESEEIAASLGNRQGAQMALVSRVWIAIRRGEWRLALETLIHGADRQLRDGDFVLFRPLYIQAWIILAKLGRFEAAAALRGRSEVDGPLVGAA